MPVAITALYAGLLGLWFVALSARVILRRRSSSISLGYDQDQTLERRIRGHGNFAEYTPFALLLLGGIELQGGAVWLIHLLGILLLVGRLMHGYSLAFTSYSPLRVPGMGMTLLMILIASLANILLAVG